MLARAATAVIALAALAAGSFAHADRGPLKRPSARAPEADEVEAARLVIEGTPLLEAGRFSEAIERFERARDLAPHKPQPYRLLGVAMARAGRCAEAIQPLDDFLSRARADDTRRREAMTLRDDCKRLVDEQRAASVSLRSRDSGGAPPAKAPQPSSPDASISAARSPHPLAVPVRPVESPRGYLKWVGAGGIAAGVAAIGAGIAMVAINGQGTCSLAVGQKQCERTYDTLGLGVGLAIGGALLTAAGGTLIYLGLPRRPKVALVPILDPRTAGFTVGGAF